MIPSPSVIATEANYSAVSSSYFAETESVICMLYMPAHTQHHATQLPDVNSELESARDALKDLDLHQSIAEGRQEFESLTQSITNSTDEIISSK